MLFVTIECKLWTKVMSLNTNIYKGNIFFIEVYPTLPAQNVMNTS
jgi:hypothetical protein